MFIKVGRRLGSSLVDCKPMELDEILPYLEPKLLRNPEKPVILYTDAVSAPYQAMISVYDVLGSAKARDARLQGQEHLGADAERGPGVHRALRVQPVRVAVRAEGGG